MTHMRWFSGRFARRAGRFRGTLPLVAALLLAGVTVAPLSISAAAMTEYAVPTADAGISYLTLGPDGNLWFVEKKASKIGRMTPAGEVAEYPLPGPSNLQGLTAGPDGNLWFALSRIAVSNTPSSIGRITPTGEITTFPTPNPDVGTPIEITAGPDGNLWYVDDSANKIGRVTPAGEITLFAIPSSGHLCFQSGRCVETSQPSGIVAGPDGNLWFGESFVGKIGRITPAGEFAEFAVPNLAAIPNTPGGFFGVNAIVKGPDGNLWFTAPGSNLVGSATPDGTITTFAVPTARSTPSAIAAGADGNCWFVESTKAVSKIASVSPAGQITEYAAPANSNPNTITTGPDGAIWFTEVGVNKIARYG